VRLLGSVLGAVLLVSALAGCVTPVTSPDKDGAPNADADQVDSGDSPSENDGPSNTGQNESDEEGVSDNDPPTLVDWSFAPSTVGPGEVVTFEFTLADLE